MELENEVRDAIAEMMHENVMFTSSDVLVLLMNKDVISEDEAGHLWHEVAAIVRDMRKNFIDVNGFCDSNGMPSDHKPYTSTKINAPNGALVNVYHSYASSPHDYVFPTLPQSVIQQSNAPKPANSQQENPLNSLAVLLAPFRESVDTGWEPLGECTITGNQFQMPYGIDDEMLAENDIMISVSRLGKLIVYCRSKITGG